MCQIAVRLTGRVDRESTSETVDPGSILARVQTKKKEYWYS